MANWYYYNKSGEKIGPISVSLMRELVQQELIGRDTVIQNRTGRTLLAGEVNGLSFPEMPVTDVRNQVATIDESDEFELFSLESDPFVDKSDTISKTNTVQKIADIPDAKKSPISITISCPSCNRKLNAKSEQAGRTLKCPACQAPVIVTAVATSMETVRQITLPLSKTIPVPPPLPLSVKNPQKPIVAAVLPVATTPQEQKTEDHRTEFQPLDEYANIYKQRHTENVSNFFEELFVKSGVNQDENRVTVKQINKLQGELDVENKSLWRAKFLQGWLIFAIVLCTAVIVGAIVIIASPETTIGWSYPRDNIVNISILALLLAITGTSTAIWAIVTKSAPRIKELKAAIAQLEEHRNSHIAVANKQMQPLTNLFERYMSSRLMEKTYPLIKLDDYFDIKRYDCLSSKYGLWSNSNVDSSTVFVQSGEINGNPFCFFTNLMHYLGTETYSGSRTVYWTEMEEYTDSDGKRRMRSVEKSERLYASVTKPCPYYNTDIVLVYGNEAAPNLTFSREDTDAEYWSEKKMEREVKRKIKQNEKQMRKAVKEGKTFTTMGNEFDALFGATDRNNEVEFRVLFTPIAQREMLKLIKDKTVSWGDDFNFTKSRMLNLIKSDHLTGYDMSGEPSNYQHYDIDTMRKKFNEYNNEYFRAVYFAFAPLLAIPLYQQHKPHEFIYKDVYSERFSCHAHEYAVNRYPSRFVHPQSRTQNILKTRIIRGGKDSDTVEVTAYGYETANRTDHVDVYHSATRQTYSVAVDWVEYLPVRQTTSKTISEASFR